MAVPTARKELNVRDRESAITEKIEDAITLYDGQGVGQGTADHATSAARGYLTHFTREKGVKSRGRFTTAGLPPQYNSDGTVKVDSRLGSSTDIKGSALIKGFQHYATAVTGASALTDVGAYVWYLEGGTVTLTIPSIDTGFSSIPDGEVLQWVTSTTCIVLEYSADYKSMLEAAGGIFSYLMFPCNWVNAADGKLISDHRMNNHGTVVEFFGRTTSVLTGASGALTFNASIGGSDITTSGFIKSTAATATIGTKTSGTVLTTGVADFHQGDLLDIDISDDADTRTTGDVLIVLRLMNKLGL